MASTFVKAAIPSRASVNNNEDGAGTPAWPLLPLSRPRLSTNVLIVDQHPQAPLLLALVMMRSAEVCTARQRTL